jgi:hypothetical protein
MTSHARPDTDMAQPAPRLPVRAKLVTQELNPLQSWQLARNNVLSIIPER